ncbi:MAG TPA: sigma 54-interacting transcriptional regulator [Clostridia bacterium]|nr:sigma 54-interacting transcriptional regulator [Clostridia bacterium]
MQDMFKTIIDEIGEGIIVIDSEGIIEYYNRKAKEIFGIIFNHGLGHEEGRIEAGDTVIIADSALGTDDGGLTPEDLLCLGVDPNELRTGYPFITIGSFGGSKGSAILKYSDRRDRKLMLLANGNPLNDRISVSLDQEAGIAVISVGDCIYSYKYVRSVGHMVVICGKTGRVKFYQAKGYTTRREDIKMLLQGNSFAAKGDMNVELNLDGHSIFDVHPKESNINIVEFLEAAKGKEISYTDQVKEINGRLTRCSLIPLKKGGGAEGAMLKVQDISELDNVIRERDYAIASLNEAENKLKLDDRFAVIIGQSDSINTVRRLARKAAETDSTVLIMGESGTGKGLVAECIHYSSKRSKKPFVYINCASIPSELIESELFGYEGGAFTGSKREGKKGLFEAADEGTIFLDEIGDMPLFMQAKLLYVLQEKKFNRVGSTDSISVNVKIIAATNKELEKLVREGSFRSDLYYRINVFPILIPPLRQRQEDIYPLIISLLPKICRRTGIKEKKISVEVIKELLSYDWPGNVRELENVLERAVNITEGDTILPEHTNIQLLKGRVDEGMTSHTLNETVENAEKAAIERAVKIAGGNKNEAMSILDISKTSFYDKLKKYGIGK